MNDHPTCNDIAIGRDGSAYVTDSAAPQILRLPPGGGGGLDGIAFGADGNLYGELFRIDMSDGKAGMGGADLTNDKWLRAHMNHPRYRE
jgi:hypothetical protein